jgi:hypothetical protein
MSTAVQTWEQVEPHGLWVRRDGESLTVQTHNTLPLLPGWLELEGQAIAARLYIDTGTMATQIDRSVVEEAGVRVEELPAEGFIIEKGAAGNAWVRPSVHRCPGRVLLWDGTPLLESGFMVPSIPAPPEVISHGAGCLLGLDALKGWTFTYDYTRRPEPGELYDPMEHDPVFTLTPRSS